MTIQITNEQGSHARDYIDLPDHDPEVVRKALRYLYYLNYNYIDPETSDNTGSESTTSTPSDNGTTSSTQKLSRPSSLALHATNYGIGCTYGIPELSSLARDKFSTALHNMVLHGTAARSIGDLTEAIHIIFTMTPENNICLREQILDYVQLDLKFLLGLREFKKVLARCPEFAFVLLVREVEDRELERE